MASYSWSRLLQRSLCPSAVYGTFTYTYDAEGNTLTRTRISTDPADDYLTEYTWDHRNRLVAVTFKDNSGDVTKVVEQGYDVFNRWVTRTIDPDGDAGSTPLEETYFVYDGAQIALQFDGDDAADLGHRYLWGAAIDELLADEDASGDVRWALTDHQGTVRDVAEYDVSTDTTMIENHNTFDSFGKKTSQSSAAHDVLFGYTGRAFDESTVLQNNLHRWYTGERWLSEDWIEDDLQNTYRYVRNSAPNMIDPVGLAPTKGGFDFYGLGLTGYTVSSGANINAALTLPNGEKFNVVLKVDSAGNPSINVKMTGCQCPNVELVQVAQTIVAEHKQKPGVVLGNMWPDKGPNKTYLQGIADHHDANGWFVDIDYASPAFTNGPGRFHPPYYNTYQGGKTKGPGTLRDAPTPFNENQVSQFVVGTYCTTTKQWLGFISWGFVVEGGKRYLLLNPVATTTMPPQFQSALDQFNQVEGKAGNSTGF